MGQLTDAKARELAQHWADLPAKHHERIGAHYGRLARLLTELNATVAADQAREEWDRAVLNDAAWEVDGTVRHDPTGAVLEVPPAVRLDRQETTP